MWRASFASSSPWSGLPPGPTELPSQEEMGDRSAADRRTQEGAAQRCARPFAAAFASTFQHQLPFGLDKHSFTGAPFSNGLINSSDVEDVMSELIRVGGCENPQRRGDVVFIHGLNGDPRDYWGLPGSYWPSWLGEDVGEVGVWSLGYENAALKPRTFSVLRPFLGRGFAMPLIDRAKNVLLTLEVNGIGHKPLVFITHSMGGLLVKQVLRTANDGLLPSYERTLLQNTKGVCFIATPHIGADLAKWVSYFRVLLDTNVSVEELRPHESLLRNLKEWYVNFVTRTEVGMGTLTFFEMKPLAGSGLVVEPGDAHSGVPHSGHFPLDEDHRTICKPQSKQSEIHLKTVSFVDACLRVVLPYRFLVTDRPDSRGGGQSFFVIEVGPHEGVWCPFLAAIPSGEKNQVGLEIRRCPKGNMPSGGVQMDIAHIRTKGISDDGLWYFISQGDEATPSYSYFITCRALPTVLVFGVDGGHPRYCVTFNGNGGTTHRKL
jgi:pimeloyl-ACP methyl ester carboxylesterase